MLLFMSRFRKHNLKVREHTILGPYVDGLSTLAVSSFEVSANAGVLLLRFMLFTVQYGLSRGLPLVGIATL